MNDNKPSVLPDVISSTSDALQKNLPATVEQADGVLSTVVGFFNNVVLYPVKQANLTFKYKLESFEEDLKKKIEDIPEEYLQVPPTMIAGPILEALRYTYDEEELREMYENLLASAMDTRVACQAHPSFVDAIKQMSPIDAQVLNTITEYGQLRCAEIRFVVKGSTKVYTNAMPNHFVVELTPIADPFLVSTSIINLQRLGLITIKEKAIISENYQGLKDHPFTLARISMFENFGKEFDVKMSEQAIIINNFGKQFTRVCLTK
ncbi:MAG: DUF4393 domain-containing protein [Clostridia bacterium]|nr:DUF4393 domain-containing protein [Clostridia bacterium]